MIDAVEFVAGARSTEVPRHREPEQPDRLPVPCYGVYSDCQGKLEHDLTPMEYFFLCPYYWQRISMILDASVRGRRPVSFYPRFARVELVGILLFDGTSQHIPYPFQ